MSGRVAFLGTGLMGAPMVRRLVVAGFAVNAWNRSADKARGLGADVARTAVEAVAGAGVVCCCLTDATAVEQVLFGPDGAARAMAPGAVLVDFSTIGPEATRALAGRLRDDLRWVDAPVSGGVRGAETGELVILCGGEADDLARAEPVLAPLAKRVCHMGGLGNGQAAKLCNQLIVGANVVAIAEAMVLGRALGLAPADLPGALAGGWADSLPLQILGPRMAAGTMEPAVVSLGTYVKDLSLVLTAAQGRAELARAAESVFAGAAAGGRGGLDVSALVEAISAWRGGEPQSPEILPEALAKPR